MDWVHVHLLLNHVPVIGAVIAIGLLIWGLAFAKNEVIRVSLGLLVVVGVTSIVVFFTGEPAEEAVENLSGVSTSIIERHEEAALLATNLVGFVGGVAALVLLRFRDRPVPRRIALAMLVMTLLPAFQLSWTATLGGQIRHSEIRAAGTSDSPEPFR